MLRHEKSMEMLGKMIILAVIIYAITALIVIVLSD